MSNVLIVGNDASRALAPSQVLAWNSFEVARMLGASEVPFTGELPNSASTNMLSKTIDGLWESAKDTWQGMSPTAKTIVGGAGALAVGLPIAKAFAGRRNTSVVVGGDGDGSNDGPSANGLSDRDVAKYALLSANAAGMCGRDSASLPLSSQLPDDLTLATISLGRAFRARGRFQEWMAEPEVMRGDVQAITDARVPMYSIGDDGVAALTNYGAIFEEPLQGGVFKKIAKKAAKVAKKATKVVSKVAPVLNVASKFVPVPGVAAVTNVVTKAATKVDKAATKLDKLAGKDKRPQPSATDANVETVMPEGGVTASDLASTANPSTPQEVRENITDISSSPASVATSSYPIPSAPGYTERGMDSLDRINARSAEVAHEMAVDGVPAVAPVDLQPMLDSASRPRVPRSDALDYI